MKPVCGKIIIMALVIIFTCHLSDVLADGAVECAKYSSDLKNKQELLTSIKEDIESLQIGLTRKIHVPITPRVQNVEITGADLVELIPPSSQISLALPQMSGTLSPESTLTHSQPDPEGKESQQK